MNTSPLKTIFYMGAVLTRYDILDMKFGRWSASRKALVLDSILQGLITKEEAVERFFPEAELDRYMEVYLANNKSLQSLGSIAMMQAEANKIKKSKLT